MALELAVRVGRLAPAADLAADHLHAHEHKGAGISSLRLTAGENLRLSVKYKMLSKSPFKEACLVTKNEVISCHIILCFGTFPHGQGIGEVCPLPIALSVLRILMVIGSSSTDQETENHSQCITHGQAGGGVGFLKVKPKSSIKRI